MRDTTSTLSRRERVLVTAAVIFGFVAAVCQLFERGKPHSIGGALLRLCNLPGTGLEVGVFGILVHVFSVDVSIHGGLAFPALLVVWFLGNPIGWGALTYLVIRVRHRVKRRSAPSAVES